MPTNPLQTIMNPESIVYLGASNSLQTIGTAQFINITKGGYKGKIYPIHRKEKSVLGLKAYLDITSINKPADLAIIVIPPKAIPGVLEECGKAGIRYPTRERAVRAMAALWEYKKIKRRNNF